ncbi:MAG: trehalose-6-phosphate synthase [Acidobacteriia bacterium]|nr:trehalose-6-phosphate synthase [Terriglobia bacterium]
MIPSPPSAVWTRLALHKLLRREFRGVRVIVVSNREPYIHRRSGGGVECIQPASGLTTALDPILRATGGVWIAHGSGDADRLAVDSRAHVAVPPGAPSYTLRRVWLDKETEERYYCGLANEGLWPLCHTAFHRPTFRLADWESYRQANRIFADAVLEEAGGDPALVFIQDYHFGLLPRLLKERDPRLTVAQFWHIPWPNRETFRVFPWKEELLDGLLGNDLLGFHLRYHCSNFLETVDRGVEAMVDSEHHEVWRGGKLTRVRPFPISIDFEGHVQEACGPAVKRHVETWRRELGNGHRFLGIGIDRADYTKGIPDRLRAVDRLLEICPEYRGQLLFLQFAVPSRTRIEDYQQLNRELAQLAEEINTRWARGEWRPIRICRRHLPQAELMALHRLSDFCMVTSLHDGMNLVAKEYAASRTDEDGVLVLSRFAGAARQLTSALLVNPFSVDEMGEALRCALTMPREERRCRMRALRSAVRENNIYTWAVNVMSTLLEVGQIPNLSAGLAAQEVAPAAVNF